MMGDWSSGRLQVIGCSHEWQIGFYFLRNLSSSSVWGKTARPIFSSKCCCLLGGVASVPEMPAGTTNSSVARIWRRLSHRGTGGHWQTIVHHGHTHSISHYRANRVRSPSDPTNIKTTSGNHSYGYTFIYLSIYLL